MRSKLRPLRAAGRPCRPLVADGTCAIQAW